MNPAPRHCLHVVLLCCLFVATGWGQYAEDSIQAPGAWVGSLVYTPEADEVWGTSWSAGMVFAIDCISNRVVTTLPAQSAGNSAYDSADGKLYCAYYGPYMESLAVIRCSVRRITKRLEMPGATTPVWDAVSNRVYVTCQLTNSVAVVDCASDSLLMYIPVGLHPIKLYINSLRHKLYVLNSDEGSVSIVDMTTNTVIKTVDVGGVATGAYYSRAVDRFYCGGNGQVIVLDGRADSVVARIRVTMSGGIYAVSGNDARGVVVASVGAGRSRWLDAINITTNTVDTAIEVSGVAWDIRLSQTSDRFYCLSDHSDEVVVLSGDGRQHLKTLPVADYPYVIAESPVQGRLYVGHLGSSKVYVIRDAITAWPEGQISTPDTTSGLQLDPSPFRDRLSIVNGTKVPAGPVGVYSEDGRLVRSINATKASGHVLRLTWDGRDSRGRVASPGVYILTAPGGLRAKAIKLK